MVAGHEISLQGLGRAANSWKHIPYESTLFRGFINSRDLRKLVSNFSRRETESKASLRHTKSNHSMSSLITHSSEVNRGSLVNMCS